MCFQTVTIFLVVFVTLSVSSLDIDQKYDSQRRKLCLACIQSRDPSCIAKTCDFIEAERASAVQDTASKDSLDQSRISYLSPPRLKCQDQGILALVWEATKDTVYFLEYSTNENRNYTELTTKSYEFIRGLQANTSYTIILTSIQYTKKQIMLRRSSRLLISTLPANRKPLPVERFYLGSLLLADEKYCALIKWDPAVDKSCYYDIVWFGDDAEDYQQIEVNNPLSLHELNITGLNLGHHYSVIIRAVSGRYDRLESAEVWLQITVPTCLEAYRSLDKCTPEAPEDFTVEEVLVHANMEGDYPVYDIIMSWSKANFTPDYYEVLIHDHARNATNRMNITGESTNATYKSIELGPHYIISLIAYSTMGPSPPNIINRYVNGTIASVVLASSWVNIDLVFIVVGPFIVVGVIVSFFFYRFLAKKLQDKHFKSMGDKYPSIINYIITGKYKEKEPDEWEIQPEKLSIEDTLGEGAFGIVRKGIYTEDERSTKVAIKMLKSNPTQEEFIQFCQEIELMKLVPRHPHLVSMVGCVTRDPTYGPLLVVEFCSEGDLQTYLRQTWDFVINSSVTEFSDSSDTETKEGVANRLYSYDLNLELIEANLPQPKDLMSFARQIVIGMEYLSSMKLIHRDLAARNILVCEDKTVKVSDFGLSRDVYLDKVYCKTTSGKLPVRWMALESMTHQVYTTQSDVWSFGILLWEIVTLGSTPYPGVSTPDLLPLLKSGYRMEKPSNCSDELYQVMCNCWRSTPKERPLFSELRIMLEDLLKLESPYLHLNIRDSNDLSVYTKHDRKYKNLTSEGSFEQSKED